MRKDGGEEINLLEYLQVLVNYRKLIIAITGACFVLSVVVSLLLPKTYSSTASVMPPQQDDMLGAVMGSKLSGSIGGLAGGLLKSKSPADLWVGILNSQSIRDAVIARFKLREVYGEETLADTRKELDGNVSVERSKEDIVSVTVEDTDPALAASMANAFIEELDRISRASVMSSGSSMRVFIEKRLDDTKSDLHKAEENLKAFQLKNKVVKLDDQSKGIIDTIVEVKTALMVKEVELDTLLSYATESNPKVGIIRAEATALRSKLRELERGGAPGAGKDIFIPTDRIPDMTFEYMRLLREVKVQEALFEIFTQQYEMMRVQESKDTPTVQILDVAREADKKTGPRRGLIVFFSTFLGLFVSIPLAFVLEYLGKVNSGRS